MIVYDWRAKRGPFSARQWHEIGAQQQQRAPAAEKNYESKVYYARKIMILLATTTMMMATAVPSTDWRRAQNKNHIVRVSMNLSNETREPVSLFELSLLRYVCVCVCWLSYHILRAECMMMHRLDRNICKQNFGINRILASYKSFDGLCALLVHIQNRQKAFSVRYLRLMLMPLCVVVNAE